MRLSAGFVIAHKRVRILVGLEVAERVVNATMNGLVGADVEQEVPHGALALGDLPVRDGDVGYLELGIRPPREAAALELVDAPRVRVHRLLLEVPDEAVADPGRDQIADEEGVEEDALGAEDHELHEPSWLAHLHEGQEVLDGSVSNKDFPFLFRAGMA